MGAKDLFEVVFYILVFRNLILRLKDVMKRKIKLDEEKNE